MALTRDDREFIKTVIENYTLKLKEERNKALTDAIDKHKDGCEVRSQPRLGKRGIKKKPASLLTTFNEYRDIIIGGIVLVSGVVYALYQMGVFP